MSNCAPRYFVAIAEHSRCQPGRPLPHGVSQYGSPGLARFHNAKSTGSRLPSTSDSPCCRLRGSWPESAPYAGNDCTEKYTSPSIAYACPDSISRRISTIISGTCPVARGSTVGSKQSSAPYASVNIRWCRSEISHHGTPAVPATARILSSMSVTLRQNVTRYPLAESHRDRTSKATADRTCPMCGGACTVAPHRYSETRPGSIDSNSRVWRLAVS